MKRLNRWPEPATKILDAVAARKPLIRRTRPRVAKAYGWYRRHAPELAGAIPCGLAPAVEAALLAAYEGAPQIAQLRAKVIAATGVCPYCGIDTPFTLDHYVPKTSFPEFALYPDNLIPCCGACNQRRGNRWLKDGKRLQVNFYFDRIGTMPLLRVDLKVRRGKVEVAYFLEPPRRGRFAGLHARHVTSLNLLDKFSRRAAQELELWERKLKHNGYGKSAGKDALKRELLRDAEAAKATYGINHWSTALYYAAWKSDTLLSYLCT